MADQTFDTGVHFTRNGTPYFTEPQCALLASTRLAGASNEWEPCGEFCDAVEGFTDGFDKDLGFDTYTQQMFECEPETLIQFAGQLCYLSLGAARTPLLNDGRYIGHLIDAGHTSVLEHASVSVLCYGVSRSLTHELVRHRIGVAYSEKSQRYTSGPTLRFVEGPEFSADPVLHARFEDKIDRAHAEYLELQDYLTCQQQRELDAGVKSILWGETATDRRKKVQQAARRELPEQTEAPIVITMNLRAWRHFLFMRASRFAEVEIRAMAMSIVPILRDYAPNVFSDFIEVALEDGTAALQCEHTA